MDTARLLTQLPLIMGLSSAALMLIFIISLSTPLTTLCSSSPYMSFPAIKSVCVEYICSMWSLLQHPTDQQPDLFSSRNLFLLVNIIVLVLLINLHLQQHAAPAATGKRSSRRRKHHHPESLIENEKVAAPLQVSSLADDHAGPAEAAAMANDALSASLRAAALDSEEIGIAEAAPMQVSDEVQELPAVTSGHIDGSDSEKIVLDEDGQLRLIGGPNSPAVCIGGTKGGGEESSKNGRLGLIESGNGVDSEEEEDAQLRLSAAVNGSDAEETVPEEVGRLRFIPRPARRPRKSHSTGDKNVDEPSEGNHVDDKSDSHISLNDFNDDSHTRSLGHSNYDMHTHSLNTPLHSPNNLNYDNTSTLNELNNGTLVIDLSSSPSLPQSPKKESAPQNSSIVPQKLKEEEAAPHQSSSKHKSSSLKRTSSRPMRAKKSESLDATWKAIINNKGSAGNSSSRENKHLMRQSSRENKHHLIRQSSRDNKHLIRQSSRQDFKPSGRGRVSTSNSNKVRREPSIGQEELNAKVESFIAKFNEQIRIQRQQSILSYMQMVDRGA